VSVNKWAALLVAIVLALSGAGASADELGLVGTPFETSSNADALPQLARGVSIRRQLANNTLTQDDRMRLNALGLGTLHSAAVSIHKIPKRDVEQIARLRSLARAVGGFAPSEACDGIVTEGNGTGLCTGSVEGPFGKVPVRMPVSAKLQESSDGRVLLTISNDRPMEAKPLFGWSEIVAPGHLKVVYEMFPADGGWLIYTRVGVEMSAHKSSAKTISDAMLKLESWLTRELART
jgi:hypothetical protein